MRSRLTASMRFEHVLVIGAGQAVREDVLHYGRQCAHRGVDRAHHFHLGPLRHRIEVDVVQL